MDKKCNYKIIYEGGFLMAKYIVLKRLYIVNVSALQNEFIVGIPAMTQWNGFIDNLSRKLKEFIHIDSFAISYHNFQLQNSIEGYTSIHNSLRASAHCIINRENYSKTDELKENAGLHDDWKSAILVSILLKYKGQNFDEEDLKRKIHNILTTNHICGGNLSEYRSEVPIEFLTDIQGEKVIKNKLMPGYVLVNRINYLNEFVEKNKKCDKLQALLKHLYSIRKLKKIKIKKMNKHMKFKEKQKIKRNIVFNKLRKGWFVPIVVGFKRISERITVTTCRDKEKDHYFVETVTSLGEFIMPNKLEINDFLWEGEYNEGIYLVKN